MAKAAKRRIIFMGTPEFGAIILEKLIRAPNIEVVAVFTKPDAKTGRGLAKTESEVKKVALAHNLSLFQPASLKDPQIAAQIAALSPDYLIVASYGLILPPSILEVAPPINVHASILPKFRGAAPIQRAMLESWETDGITGISIMKMEKGLDTGPVYATREVPIADKSFTELTRDLANEGGDLLLEVMSELPGLEPQPQENDKATYAEKIVKEDGLINWQKPVRAVLAQIKALEGWPGAYGEFALSDGNCSFSILEAQPAEIEEKADPGHLIAKNGKLFAGCEDGWLEILQLKPQGRKIMDGKSFVNGKCRIRNGSCGRSLA